MVHPYQESYHYQQMRIPPPPPQIYGDRTQGWNPNFYEGPVKYAYQNYPGMNPQVSSVPQPQYPPQYYQSFPQSYHPQPNPYLNPVHLSHQQYFPPPNSVQYPYS